VEMGSAPSTASIALPARAHALRIRSAVVGAVVGAGADIFALHEIR
jgi:hypothetical protein